MTDRKLRRAGLRDARLALAGRDPRIIIEGNWTHRNLRNLASRLQGHYVRQVDAVAMLWYKMVRHGFAESMGYSSRARLSTGAKLVPHGLYARGLGSAGVVESDGDEYSWAGLVFAGLVDLIRFVQYLDATPEPGIWKCNICERWRYSPPGGEGDRCHRVQDAQDDFFMACHDCWRRRFRYDIDDKRPWHDRGDPFAQNQGRPFPLPAKGRDGL